MQEDTNPTTITPDPHAEKQLAKVSDKDNLRMIEYLPQYYAGYNKDTFKDRAIALIFPENENIIGLEGDQGVGKSSNLACLKALLGADEVANAINEESGDKKAQMTIRKSGRTYISKITKTAFTLTEIEEPGGPGKKQVTSEKRRPKEVLRELVGPLATDPVFLKSMTGKEQVEYIRKMVQPGEDAVRLEYEIEQNIKKTFEERRDYNKEVKRTKTVLSMTPFYEWDDKNKTMVPTDVYLKAKPTFQIDLSVRDQELREAFEVATKKNQAFENAETLKQELSAQKKVGEEKVLDLERQLQEAIENFNKQIEAQKEANQLLNTRIENGDQFIEANKGVKDELAIAKKAWEEQGEFKIAKNNIEQAEKLYQEFNASVLNAQNADAKLHEYYELQKQFVKSITPEIDGLEICVPKNVDVEQERLAYKETNPAAGDDEVTKYVLGLKHETRDGIYYKGHTLAQLSESELFGFWILLCKAMGIRVAFIENISSLGTDAIEAINQFAEAGGTVFYTAMERSTKELKISFQREIK